MLHGLMCRTRFQRPLFRCSRQAEGSQDTHRVPTPRHILYRYLAPYCHPNFSLLQSQNKHATCTLRGIKLHTYKVRAPS